ncbi:unnamed protein product [Leuciscus chuanchicus]
MDRLEKAEFLEDRIDALEPFKISIMALSELRLTGSGTMTVQLPGIDGTMTLYSGSDKQEAGVGFMVDTRAASSITTFQPISDRLAVLTVQDSAILDYILINNRFCLMLRGVRAMRGPDCGSDHHLIRAKIQLKLQRAQAYFDPTSQAGLERTG